MTTNNKDLLPLWDIEFQPMNPDRQTVSVRAKTPSDARALLRERVRSTHGPIIIHACNPSTGGPHAQ